ncbi:hypothetical protein P3T18_000503 [Paraburkholderia sp. GAS199]|uniref:hypothetical protein n=1 Tax=Paraburkholderia sp. GAS199 TaxID=3035126 RepID=UPI003D2089EB
MLPRLDAHSLADLALRSHAASQACSCMKTPVPGWESMPLSLPEEQLREVATLVSSEEEEPTFEEFHPNGTRYWSADAPIAQRYFPYNRCNVWECTVCGRHFLRYTEGGGYFVDRRIRLLDPALIVDAPL